MAEAERNWFPRRGSSGGAWRGRLDGARRNGPWFDGRGGEGGGGRGRAHRKKRQSARIHRRWRICAGGYRVRRTISINLPRNETGLSIRSIPPRPPGPSYESTDASPPASNATGRSSGNPAGVRAASRCPLPAGTGSVMRARRRLHTMRGWLGSARRRTPTQGWAGAATKSARATRARRNRAGLCGCPRGRQIWWRRREARRQPARAGRPAERIPAIPLPLVYYDRAILQHLFLPLDERVEAAFALIAHRGRQPFQRECGTNDTASFEGPKLDRERVC